MINNKEWQALPGTQQAEIYPYLRKPDLLSSNSCVIRTPEQIVLIDAGALASQTAELCRVLKQCYEEKPRPILIYLTHGHIDHFLEVDGCRRALAGIPVRVGIQEDGAEYLIQGDPGKTIAELYGMSFPSLKTDIRLLTARDRNDENIRTVDLLPSMSLLLHTEKVQTDSGQTGFKQKVPIGGGEHLEFYPIPGHSPDSVCIRIGEVLFIGDLLAAAGPMVAGISGWNRGDFIRSLRLVMWLLDSQPIRYCCPGHGGIIPADKIRDILLKLQHRASRLGDIVEMNADRLFQVTEYALELIDEAEEVFSSIAGRLLYVAYQLEELEEEEAAERCRKAMQMDQIDACLLEFRNLFLSLDEGNIRRVEFAHRALNIVERMKSLFDPRPLSMVLSQLMINRGTGILLDFIGIANGYRNLEEFLPTDLNALIEDAVCRWQSSPRSDPSIIDVADDRGKFLAGLVSRIGASPSADRPPLDFSPADKLPFVRVAAARLSDTLLDFLEWIGQDDQKPIKMATGIEDGRPFLTVLHGGRDGSSAGQHELKKIRSFSRRFRLCGLSMERENGGCRWKYQGQVFTLDK